MKKWNKAAVLVLALMLAATTAACGASSGGAPRSAPAASSAAPAMADMEQGEVMAKDKGGTETLVNADTATQPQVNRKLIRTVHMDIEAKDFDGLTSTVMQQIEALGGYTERSEVNGGGYNTDNRHYASIVARIPSDKVDQFIGTVKEQGNVTSQQESVDDVTLQYVDVESHKKSLKIEQERLLALLEKANRLEDIIALEQRLSEVRYQLESYESQLRMLDNQVEYSTVNMNISEVERITPVENKTVWSRMSSGVQQSVYDIGKGLQNFSVWFVVKLPYFVLWALFAGVISLVLIKLFSHPKKGRNAKAGLLQKTTENGGENPSNLPKQ